MKNNILNLFLFFATVAIVIYSCGKLPAQQATNPAGGASVSIQNFAFVPDTVRIKVGQTITWTNKDTAPHTSTALAGAFNSGNLITNQTYQFTFNAAGTYSYHCLVHPMMVTAYVIVTN